jgi:hypothetical protein
MSEVIAGVRIPDSKLAREATELLREHGTPLLLAHSLRVYLFGAIRGRHRGLAVDHELLYFGAVFHDLGLTTKYRSPDHRLEVDGANAARDFLRANGIGHRRPHKQGAAPINAAHPTPDPLPSRAPRDNAPGSRKADIGRARRLLAADLTDIARPSFATRVPATRSSPRRSGFRAPCGIGRPRSTMPTGIRPRRVGSRPASARPTPSAS